MSTLSTAARRLRFLVVKVVVEQIIRVIGQRRGRGRVRRLGACLLRLWRALCHGLVNIPVGEDFLLFAWRLLLCAEE